MRYSLILILAIISFVCLATSQPKEIKQPRMSRTTKDTLVHDFVKGEGKISVNIPDSVKIVLFNSSNESTGSKQLPWIVAALISLLTVGVNIWINRAQRKTTIKLAVLQHESNVVSKNRQEWINTLRDCIAELLSSLANYNMKMASQKRITLNREKIQTWDESKQIMFNRWKSRLLLNSSGEKPEEDHVKLDNALEEIVSYLITSYEEFDDEKYKTMCENIVLISQKIIKVEWDRIGKFEKEVDKILGKKSISHLKMAGE